MRPIALLALVAALVIPDLAAAQGATSPPVKVRFGEHKTFNRMVIDWPARVPYRVTQTPGRATLRFERSASLDLARYGTNPPPLIKGIETRPDKTGLTVHIDVPQGAGLRHFENGTHVVIDVYGSAAVAQAATVGRLVTMSPKLAAPVPAPPKPKVALKTAQAPRIAQAAEPKSTKPRKKRRGSSWNATPHRGFTLGPNISTLGLGAEIGYRFNDYIGLRAGANYWGEDFSHRYAGIDYDVDLTLLSGGAFVDIYPFRRVFRLTGGVRYNANQIDLSATPTTNVDIGGMTFTPAEVGTLDAEVDFRDVAPYAGIGFEGSILDGRLVFGADLGVFFQGSPDIDMTTNGLLASDPTFLAELESEVAAIEDDLDVLAFYPVIGFSATFRF